MVPSPRHGVRRVKGVDHLRGPHSLLYLARIPKILLSKFGEDGHFLHVGVTIDLDILPSEEDDVLSHGHDVGGPPCKFGKSHGFVLAKASAVGRAYRNSEHAQPSAQVIVVLLHDVGVGVVCGKVELSSAPLGVQGRRFRPL